MALEVPYEVHPAFEYKTKFIFLVLHTPCLLSCDTLIGSLYDDVRVAKQITSFLFHKITTISIPAPFAHTLLLTRTARTGRIRRGRLQPNMCGKSSTKVVLKQRIDTSSFFLVLPHSLFLGPNNSCRRPLCSRQRQPVRCQDPCLFCELNPSSVRGLVCSTGPQGSGEVIAQRLKSAAPVQCTADAHAPPLCSSVHHRAGALQRYPATMRVATQ
jgi:hypothetical protein